jgi:hypothetical protein
MTRLRLPAGMDDATHTIQRMIERNVTWPEIVAVVASPTTSRPGHSGRTNHYRVVNGRRLRVTIDDDSTVWTVAVT